MSYLRKFRGTSTAVIGVAILAIGTIDGATWGQCELEKLLPSDGEAFDQFGNSVAISGDLAIMGAHLRDGTGSDSGAAYIFRFNGTNWEEEAKLLASDGSVFDEFGFAGGIDGNVVIVGAPFATGSDQGRIYLYRFDGLSWIEEAEFTHSSGSAEFGFSVAISGDVAIAEEHLSSVVPPVRLRSTALLELNGWRKAPSSRIFLTLAISSVYLLG